MVDRGRGGPGGWIILDEPELHLHGDILVPDIAGWRRERMPALPEGSAFDLAPDWVCEVLSPSTASIDRTEKLPIYARERLAHVWSVDAAHQDARGAATRWRRLSNRRWLARRYGREVRALRISRAEPRRPLFSLSNSPPRRHLSISLERELPPRSISVAILARHAPSELLTQRR